MPVGDGSLALSANRKADMCVSAHSSDRATHGRHLAKRPDALDAIRSGVPDTQRRRRPKTTALPSP
jgi:hypothetical protein